MFIEHVQGLIFTNYAKNGNFPKLGFESAHFVT